MSTGLIIAIVVVALIAIALIAFVLPRARHRARIQARERELEQRRERAADEHREEASERSRMAERAEEKARMAEAEARRERADADLHEQRAERHARGDADDELIEDHERDRFAETSAVRDDDTGTADDTPRRSEDPSASSAYDQGRIDERRDEEEDRFRRSPESERTN